MCSVDMRGSHARDRTGHRGCRGGGCARMCRLFKTETPTPTKRRAATRSTLEGLEHVLSILYSDAKRQLPRNYADSRTWDGIARRPKTTSDEWDAGKMRAKIARRGAGFRGTQRMTV